MRITYVYFRIQVICFTFTKIPTLTPINTSFKNLHGWFFCSTDAGCISIRLVESLDGQPLPVVFSLFQDIFPVFCVDISPRMRVGSGGQPSTNHYLATVEWSGTFNNVHDGLLNVYKGFQVDCTTHADVEQKRKRFLIDQTTSADRC